MKIEYISFSTRSERSKYIANKFGKYIEGSLLDVGCDKAVLKTLIPKVDYVGIDVGGEPDMLVDLEKIEALPFEDAQFHAVVCSDVLEHIDNLHQIFDELVRVTNKYLIISLPNNWCNARRPIERGKGQISFYGLPPVKPLDRHKWWWSQQI